MGTYQIIYSFKYYNFHEKKTLISAKLRHTTLLLTNNTNYFNYEKLNIL